MFEIAAAAPLGPLDAQRVLEAHGTAARSAVLHEYLGELADMLRDEPNVTGRRSPGSSILTTATS